MLAKARIAFDLICPGCDNALRMDGDKQGTRYAICKNLICKYYEREFVVPTGELLTRLLKLHERENT